MSSPMSLTDRIGAQFEELAARDAYPGVVLVERGGATVYEGAFGLASRAWRVPNTLDTRFDTASITKLFTTVAVLQLIDAGLLGFDTSVVELLDLTGTAISPAVTVLHCLTHTSGIGDDADEEAGEDYADLWRERPNYSVRETVDFLPQFVHRPPNFPPGTGCRYNNVAFVLLGLCIERVTGTSYRDRVREHVFARAGMTRSDFFSMDLVAGDVAEGVDPVLDASGAVVAWRRNIYSYPPVGSPDGGAHVTAADLARFLRAARHGELLSAELTTRLFEPHAVHSVTDARISRYGLCLEHVSSPDDQPLYVQKDGYNAGTSGIVRHYPATDTTVVMLSNTSGGVWDPLRALDRIVGSD